MKKRVIIGIMALCAVFTLSACNTAEKPADNTVAITTTVAESVEDNTADAEGVVGEEDVLDDTIGEETEIVDENTSEATDESSTSEPVVDERHVAVASAIEEVISSSEHAAMAEVTDPMMLKEFFLIDIEDTNIKTAVVYQCPMNAVMSEIIVLEADDVEAAKAILEQRKTKAIEQDAFYPDDVANAEASIVDTCGNFAYFIINSTAADDAIVLDMLLSAM